MDVQRPEERWFFPELEALRGVAALSVVGHHACGSGLVEGDLEGPAYIGKFILQLVFPGNAAVVFFFVLSGFVLSQSVRRAKPFNFPSYAVRRVFRIIPAMWFSIALALAVNVLIVEKPPEWLSAFRAMLFLDFSINPPLWTLKQEFYLSIFLLPLLAFAAHKLSATFNAALLAGMFYYFIGDGGVMLGGYMFYLGCLVPTIGRSIVLRIKGSLAIPVVVASAALFLSTTPITQVLAYRNMMEFFPYALALSAIPSFLLVSYFVAHAPSWPHALLNTRPFRFVGTISFSIFILHWPLIAVVMQYITERYIIVLMTFALTIAVAAVAYHLIERPGMALGQRLVSTFPVIWARRRLRRPSMAASTSAASISSGVMSDSGPN